LAKAELMSKALENRKTSDSQTALQMRKDLTTVTMESLSPDVHFAAKVTFVAFGLESVRGTLRALAAPTSRHAYCGVTRIRTVVKLLLLTFATA